MDGQTLVARSEVRRRPERVGAAQHALVRPPESDLPPARNMYDAKERERRAWHVSLGHDQVPGTETCRKETAVARVAVEQLDDAGRVARGADALLDAFTVDRVDHPDTSIHDESMGGTLEPFSRDDPAEPARKLVAREQFHWRWNAIETKI